MKMLNLNSFAKLGVFIYIIIYLIFPKLAIPQNTKIDQPTDDLKTEEKIQPKVILNEESKIDSIDLRKYKNMRYFNVYINRRIHLCNG